MSRSRSLIELAAFFSKAFLPQDSPTRLSTRSVCFYFIFLIVVDETVTHLPIRPGGTAVSRTQLNIIKSIMKI